MYAISENGVITMFQGDCVALEVSMPVYDAAGEPTGENYEMQEGDVLTLTVRRAPGREFPVLMQVVSVTARLLITPGDTRDMEPGEYSADIELRRADGSVDTIFPLLENLSPRARKKTVNWKNFIITGEVTADD